MMIRRVKMFLALGALLMTLPIAASAQISRVEGMSLQGDYIKDYTGIYTYTSSVSNVGNLVYGELGIPVAAGLIGASVDRGMGVVLGNLWDGRYGTWAVHMREFTPQLGQSDQNFATPAPGSFGFDPNSN